jgi:hypothetical protein
MLAERERRASRSSRERTKAFGRLIMPASYARH